MPYSKTSWVDNATPAIDAANLNNIETGISEAPYGPDASSNQVPIWNGSGWTYATVGASQITAGAVGATQIASSAVGATQLASGAVSNTQVNASAAIAYSKLSLAGSIVNADIASGAAIATSKLALTYASYTPTWGSSTGSPPAIGNGTIVGSQVQIGKLVTGNIIVTMGSTTTFGSAAFTFSLPAAGPFTANFPVGTAVAYDLSADAGYSMALVSHTTTTCILFTPAQPATYGAAAIPFTFATGDVIYITFSYQAA